MATHYPNPGSRRYKPHPQVEEAFLARCQEEGRNPGAVIEALKIAFVGLTDRDIEELGVAREDFLDSVS